MSTMSVRSAAAGTATAALVVGVLGSPALVDAGQDLAERHRSPLTAETLTGLPNWDVFDRGTPTDVVWGIVLKLGVFLVVVALLAGLAGRASRRSAFLGGWASVVVAAGIAGAVHYVYEDAVVGARQNPFQVSYFDNLLGAVNTGAGFGLWTGWLVGLAVAATARLPVRSPLIPRVDNGPIARSPEAPPITPPAPWWAADASPLSPVRYNAASVFPHDSGSPSADPTLVASEPDAPSHPVEGNGTKDDADLQSTLATPLARQQEDQDTTRPIPLATMDPAAVDPTVVGPVAANPTPADPT